MSNAIAIMGAVLAGAIACLGCKNEECDKSRVALASKWEELARTANRRASGAVEGSGSPATWKLLQEQAALVQSSFETEQVTWPAAERGKQQVEAQFQPLASAEDAQAFKLKLTEATEAFTAYEQACR